MRMKKLIFILIKSILITFTIFSFVACGGGGSSGGDDYYDEPEIPSVSEVVETPAVPDEVVAIPSEQPEQSEPDDADGSIRIGAPRYSSLPVTLACNGITLTQPATGNTVPNLPVTRGQEITVVVQQEYESYTWYLNGTELTPGTVQDNGRTCSFTPEGVGNFVLQVQVTNNGSIGSFSVNLAVSE